MSIDTPHVTEYVFAHRNPAFRFLKREAGIFYLLIPASPRMRLKLVENDYDLGLVDVKDVMLTEGGLHMGYLFTPHYSVQMTDNSLTIYRERIKDKAVELIKQKKPDFTFRYKLPGLRVYTIGRDLVSIGSEHDDHMKQHLEQKA